MNTQLKVFADHQEAGTLLAEAIAKRELKKPLIVLGLPRGGVPLAYEVAKRLGAPLDVLVVRKIGMPGNRELAIGAIASGGITVRDSRRSRRFALSFDRLEEEQTVELRRREHLYRSGLPPLDLTGKTAILVDDGLATGLTMLAAVRGAWKANADRVVAAAPVGSHEAVALISSEVDDVIILQMPRDFGSIGRWYERFEQLWDQDVCDLLELRWRESSSGGAKRRKLTAP
jgi:putative phosphoribosyl transferase